MTRKGVAAGFALLLAACTVAYLPTDKSASPPTETATTAAGGMEAATRRASTEPGRRLGRIAGNASGHCRAQECALGSLVADAVLWRLADKGAVAAILPSHAIRGFLREGDIMSGDVEAAIAQERMIVRDLRGADIRARLEEALGGAGQESGQVPQVSGLRYVWSPSHPPGRRLMSATIADAKGVHAPLSSGKTYRIAVNGVAEAERDGAVDIAHALIALLESQSPLAVPSPGRIVER